ncbi:helix-turn-helix transcriptional regulator [Sharpea azabuensis]|nr:helix-turn-helix domain-containing protein [Sharpea azabuensis]HCJ15398.1 helix-turn-helix domain-containing protein [Erysipelotrichaceae bacterium]
MKNRIEEIRKIKGIRQDELGKMLGVSRQTISS